MDEVLHRRKCVVLTRPGEPSHSLFQVVACEVVEASGLSTFQSSYI